MDEVRADRLIEKHGKNALLVIIHDWPQKRKYKEKPELIPSLEYLVSIYFTALIICYSRYIEPFLEKATQNTCKKTNKH